MKTVETFSKRLSDLISESKITYEELGKKTEIKPQTLNRWALGQRVPKITSIQPLAEAFSVNPLWLAGYDVPKFMKYASGGSTSGMTVGATGAGHRIIPECEELEKICLQLNQQGLDALVKYARYLLTDDQSKKGQTGFEDIRKEEVS